MSARHTEAGAVSEGQTRDPELELRVLRLPIYTGVLVAGLALVAGPLTGSQAILLDGFFGLIYLVTGIFTYRVGRLLQHGASRRFPFGRAPLEPLVNLIKSLLIAGVSMLSIWYAGSSLLGGGAEIEFGGAVIFAFVSATITIGMAGYVWVRYRHIDSPLVQGDLSARMIDALTAFGALLAFLAAYALHANGYADLARYVDPVLTLALVALTIGIPYSLGRRALSELIYVAPPASEVAPLESKIKTALHDIPLGALDIRTVRIGRTWEIMVHAQLRDDTPFDMRQADRYRQKVADIFIGEKQAVRPVLVFSYMPTEPLR